MPAEKVARNQRGRLYGAMVASVAERGYSATRLSDLTELSGVSRNSFYNLFADKQACFIATIEAVLGGALEAVTTPTGSWEEQVRSVTTTFANLFVTHPAAARMCLIEANAVGPEGLRPVEGAIAEFEAHALGVAAKSPAYATMPPEMVAAQVGAIVEIARVRLRHGTEAEMPLLVDEFVELMLAWSPPPEPLKLATRPPIPAPETIDAPDRGERALRALAIVAAEHGYANVTVNQIVKSAAMSPTTFYANFRDKEDALMAAIDSASAQILAAILPPFRRSSDWPSGVRAAIGAFFNFLASRPALAKLLMVEVHAVGPQAVGRRQEALQPLGVLLAESLATLPRVPAIATEAIPGAVSALAYKQIRDAGPESLPGLAPVCTYLTLAPFIGPDAACAAANGDGLGRGSGAPALPRRLLLSRIARQLKVSDATVDQLAKRLGARIEEVGGAVDELVRGELVQPAGETPDGQTIYQTASQLFDAEAWDKLNLPERQRISRSIGKVLSADLEEALASGTFDARERALTHLPMSLDEQGWKRMMQLHNELFQASLEVQSEASRRMQETREPPIDGRSIQIFFELPPPGPPAVDDE